MYGEGDTDDENMQAAMQGYSAKLNQMKESSQRIFESMQYQLGKGKVNFNFKTQGIIMMFACLRMIRKR